jgi:hypothetical protein
LKPEWWGSPLAQGEKYQGRKRTCDKNDDDDDNNNNKAMQFNMINACWIRTSQEHSGARRQPPKIREL